MIIQIIGTKKSKATSKAIRFFKERNISFQFIDLNIRGLSEGELTSICRHIPAAELFDTECKIYKKYNLEYLTFDEFEKLLEYPLLLKTPVVRSKETAICGYDETFYKNNFL